MRARNIAKNVKFCTECPVSNGIGMVLNFWALLNDQNDV